MYEAFYNLRTDPFRLSPDHSFCYGHSSYVKAKTYLQYGLQRAEGIVILTGGWGIGKTTLSHDVSEQLSAEQVVVGRIMSTQLCADDFLRMVALSYGIHMRGVDKATIFRQIEEFAIEQDEAGQQVILMIDDAQELEFAALKELLPLVNLQRNSKALMQILMLGDDRLRDALRARGLEQLYQRVVVVCRLEPLGLDETQAYVKHRLTQAGWKGDPRIAGEVFPSIHHFSRGVPRGINLVASRLLLNASLEQKHELCARDVRLVIEGLRWERGTPFIQEASPQTHRDLRTDINQELRADHVVEEPRPNNEAGSPIVKGDRILKRKRAFLNVTREHVPRPSAIDEALTQAMRGALSHEGPESSGDAAKSHTDHISNQSDAIGRSEDEERSQAPEQTAGWMNEVDLELPRIGPAGTDSVTDLSTKPRFVSPADAYLEGTDGDKASVASDKPRFRPWTDDGRRRTLRLFMIAAASAIIGFGAVVLVFSPLQLPMAAQTSWHSFVQRLESYLSPSEGKSSGLTALPKSRDVLAASAESPPTPTENTGMSQVPGEEFDSVPSATQSSSNLAE